MKYLIFLLIALIIPSVTLADKFDLETYGAPNLYYSKQGIQQREELKALNEANQIAQEQLDVEKARLGEQKEIDDKIKQELNN